MDEFVEAGGMFLDTANIYASFISGFVRGESETVIGDWMAARRNRSRMVVATKVAGGYLDTPRGLRSADIERECERSLRRLRTDVIDLYYAHVDDRETPLEESVEAFHRLVAAGKVRFVGVSNWHTWRLAEARLLAEFKGWPRLAALEFRYSYLRPVSGADFGDQIAVTDQLLDYARTKRVTVVAYSTLLNGAYTRTDRELPRNIGDRIRTPG
jgi:aryl-alcohol dehydrogenase-like predicted oxidoreductase